MELVVTKIEPVDLPNYLETVWRGKVSTTVEAPLLGKYCVTIEYQEIEESLFLEVRKQPNDLLIDEYYPDQIYRFAEKVAKGEGIHKTSKVWNPLMEALRKFSI